MGVPTSLTGEHLPIFPHKQSILKLISDNDVVILSGTTGSGKTTQIPKFIYSSRDRLGLRKGRRFKMAITQPRRVAAISVASRVAEELGVTKLGTLVGYQVRFEDCTTPETAIKFATDGMLVREAILDSDFSAYDVIIVDEVHERSLHTDILLGLLYKALTGSRKGQLKVVIMSATLSVDSFKRYFEGTEPHLIAGIKVASIDIPGRTYPVTEKYLVEPEPDYVEASVITALQIHLDQVAADKAEISGSTEELADGSKTPGSSGDILIFLPGQEDIEAAREALEKKNLEISRRLGADYTLEICAIYAALPQEQQLEIFAPSDKRKVILATNIAETSITVPGVVYVIDCGLVKQKGVVSSVPSLNPNGKRPLDARPGALIETLRIVPASIASITQRAGRAGRVRPGFCFRLFPESVLDTLEKTTPPEILRSDLATVALQMKAMTEEAAKRRTQSWGELSEFPFVDRPDIALCKSAEKFLVRIGAFTRNQTGFALTPLGGRLAALPVHPLFGRVLEISARPKFDCLSEALTLVAMASADNIWAGRGGSGRQGMEWKNPLKKQPRGFNVSFDSAKGDHLYLIHCFQRFKADSGQAIKTLSLNGTAVRKAMSIRDQLKGVLKNSMVFKEGTGQRTETSADDKVESSLSCIQGLATTSSPDDIPNFSVINSCADDTDKLKRALTKAAFVHVARRVELNGTIGVYETIDRHRCYIHPSSICFSMKPQPEVVVFTEMVKTLKVYMRYVTPIEPAWLPELVPEYFKPK